MAGIVFVNEFVTNKEAHSKAIGFDGYVDYIDRDNANMGFSYEDYMDSYMDNPEKAAEEDRLEQSNLFSVSSNRLSKEDKYAAKEAYKLAQKNGSNLWRPIISFENSWLIETGLYDEKTKTLDRDRYINIMREAIQKVLQEEDLENAVWVGSIHFNTDNIHTHFSIVEPFPARRRTAEGEYRGKFRQSSIEKGKQVVVNRALQTSKDLQKINEIMREKILDKHPQFREDPEMMKMIRDLYQKLPQDRRTWKYGMNAMKSLRPEIDKISRYYMNKYHSEDVKVLLNLLQKQQKIYARAYGKPERNLYAENQIDDLFKRMGNQILREIRKMDRDIRQERYRKIKKEQSIKNTIQMNPDNQYQEEKTNDRSERSTNFRFQHQRSDHGEKGSSNSDNAYRHLNKKRNQDWINKKKIYPTERNILLNTASQVLYEIGKEYKNWKNINAYEQMVAEAEIERKEVEREK